MDKMLNYEEAAAFLGVKIATLYSMVSRGQVPHARIGRRLVRFPREALLAWLHARTFIVPEKPEASAP